MSSWNSVAKEILKKMLRLAIIVLLISIVQSRRVPSPSEDSTFWMKVGRDTLENRLKSNRHDLNDLKAKNIIIYLGGGMGVTTVTASRIYKGQLNNQSGEEASLSFEDFPHTGLAKVYSTNQQVPDAGSPVTAIFTGSKTKGGALSMDNTCNYKDSRKGSLTNFMEWAQKVGKRTGFVTTSRITNPPLAALYAKLCNGHWECDSSIPKGYRGVYKDATLQFLENGHYFNVILGGGLSAMGAYDANETTKTKIPPSSAPVCQRLDKRNIVEEWLKLYGNRAFVKTKDDLFNIDTKSIDHLMGLFRNDHLSYAVAREENVPSLEELTQKAIEVLDRPDSNGFVLLVEDGQVDHAHHQNLAKVVLHEVLELDNAVKKGVEMTDEEDTLIIVTADHSQAMTISGNPVRGNDILGTSNNPAFETLTWANGPGFKDHRASEKLNEINTYSVWNNVDDLKNRDSITYRHLAAIPLRISTHSGEDVPVYARGPGSSLIRGVFEQNYIGHVMSYVGCMGPTQDVDDVCKIRNGSTKLNPHKLMSVLIFVSLVCRFSVI